jgi:hypothetical protein
MTEDEAFAAEESFWTEGADHYAAALDPSCLMVFGEVGTLDRDAILAAMATAPRWRKVSMSDRRMTRPDERLCLIAYRAEAEREDGTSLAAWCSSAYRRTPLGWRLFQHQQTPA